MDNPVTTAFRFSMRHAVAALVLVVAGMYIFAAVRKARMKNPNNIIARGIAKLPYAGSEV